MRRAIELYETAAVRTQKEASEAVGLHPGTLAFMRSQYPEVKAYQESLSSSVRERVVDFSATIKRLSEKALAAEEALLDGSQNEKIVFEVARDILDRNPETSKTHRLAVSSLSLTGRDVESLSRALVEGAALRQQFAVAAAGDFTPGLGAKDPFAGEPES